MGLNSNCNHKTGRLSFEAVEKMAKALELRKAGLTFDRIAEEMGLCDRGLAYKYVMRGLKRTLQEPADDLRRLENERIDAMWGKVYEKAKEGNLEAIDRCMKLMDRRAKLLGLDAPAKADLTSNGQPLAPKIVRVIQPPMMGEFAGQGDFGSN